MGRTWAPLQTTKWVRECRSDLVASFLNGALRRFHHDKQFNTMREFRLKGTAEWQIIFSRNENTACEHYLGDAPHSNHAGKHAQRLSDGALRLRTSRAPLITQLAFSSGILAFTCMVSITLNNL